MEALRRSLALAILLVFPAAAGGDQTLLGKKLLVTNPPSGATNNKVVHLARDTTVTIGPAGSAGDPQCTGAGGGGSSSVRVTASGGAGDVTIPLPCGGWTTNDANTRYRYRDTTGATCRVVLVRAGALAKAVCKGTQVALDVNGGMAPITVTTTLNGEAYVTEWADGIVADGSDGIRFLAKKKPAGAESFLPVGGEFQVNTYTTHAQYPTLGRGVARAPDGRFVVAFAQRNGTEYGVAARRYDATGAPIGEQFQVNTYTTRSLYNSAVAIADDGSFVVVWERDDDGIFGRRFDATGAPVGGEFQVNTFTTNYSLYRPSVSSAADGSFVVVWYDANYEDVRGRRFDASGAAVGPDFEVASYTTERQNRPDVSMAADGSFVVTWESYHPDDDHGGGIRARRFDATGTPLGPEFAINTYTTNEQIRPAVSVAGNQGFVVVWNSWQQDGSGYGVQGRRYDATGTALGPEFQVNAYTTGMQEYPDVAADGDRGFVVVWRASLDGSYRSVHARRFDASGLATTGDLLVNTYTTGFQQYQSVATDGAGNYIVVWYTPHPGDNADTVGQRFCVDEDSDGDCG